MFMVGGVIKISGVAGVVVGACCNAVVAVVCVVIVVVLLMCVFICCRMFLGVLLPSYCTSEHIVLAVIIDVIYAAMVCMAFVVKRNVRSVGGMSDVWLSVSVGSAVVVDVVAGTFALSSCTILARLGGFAIRVATLSNVDCMGKCDGMCVTSMPQTPAITCPIAAT